ncbi:uncharacterized protein IL334_003358 [Kwoniella shivajii]|uniref:Palmitoyltransferase n=1 Tax=Kwoniella shivajii TaxID=564305 RepID=A0ABZ1D1G0_9TREE|nr:hypothetical protein IL334_003358 [Kwoniella shivajii]
MGERDHDELSQNHSSPFTLGVALPTRSASVTLLREQAGESASAQACSSSSTSTSISNMGLMRRDSLEDTKSFYGVRPTSPPDSTIHRTASSSQRGTAAQRVRSSSLLSSNSSITSPSRTAVPLPTPRGFLSPKKPNSAIRLERKSSSVSDTDLNTKIKSKSRSNNFHSTLPTEYENLSTNQQDQDPDQDQFNTEMIATNSISPTFQETETEAASPTFALSSSFSLSEQQSKPPNNWDRSIGRSITEMSTPPRTAISELSSDELVNRNRGRDIEKANGHGTNDGMREANDFRLSKSAKSWRTNPNNHSRSNSSKFSDGKHRRKYETLNSSNPLTTFFWSGRLMTGGDNWWSLIGIVVILLGISGVWLGTTGAWLWQHGREYGLVKGSGIVITIIFVYLFGITTSSLIASAFRDPGIIPRGLDLDPPVFDDTNEWEAWPRDLTINGSKILVKYCDTCRSYRPPRSSHCRLCGNCVDGIDHHCSYLHQCVGKRNYFSFLVLLVSATISDIYIIIFSALHFSLLCHHDHVSFGKALSESPGAAVSFLLGVLLTVPILFLLWYHIRLLIYNLTTVEQIRANTSNSLFAKAQRPDNPFMSNSLFSNIILASIGRPQFPSWIDANGFEDDDKREINPALKDLKWSKEKLSTGI